MKIPNKLKNICEYLRVFAKRSHYKPDNFDNNNKTRYQNIEYSIMLAQSGNANIKVRYPTLVIGGIFKSKK